MEITLQMLKGTLKGYVEILSDLESYNDSKIDFDIKSVIGAKKYSEAKIRNIIAQQPRYIGKIAIDCIEGIIDHELLSILSAYETNPLERTKEQSQVMVSASRRLAVISKAYDFVENEYSKNERVVDDNRDLASIIHDYFEYCAYMHLADDEFARRSKKKYDFVRCAVSDRWSNPISLDEGKRIDLDIALVNKALNGVIVAGTKEHELKDIERRIAECSGHHNLKSMMSELNGRRLQRCYIGNISNLAMLKYARSGNISPCDFAENSSNNFTKIPDFIKVQDGMDF